MSNNNSNGQLALPDPQAAYDTLFTKVHSRAFFGKLASYGYAPRNEKEAADLLDLAGKLRVVAQEPRVKAAQADNPYAQASARLDHVLQANGLDTHVKTAAVQEREIGLRNAAAQLMTDPSLYNAAISLKAAEAQQVGQQLGLIAAA